MADWGGRYAQDLLTYLLATRPHVCGRCLGPIDASLRGSRSKRRPSTGHKTPRSRGGTDADDNLRLEHFDCNAAGGNRTARRPARRDARFFRNRPAAEHPAPNSLLSPERSEKTGITTKTRRHGKGTR